MSDLDPASILRDSITPEVLAVIEEKLADELTPEERVIVAFLAGCEVVVRNDGLIARIRTKHMVTIVDCHAHGFHVYERRHDG